MRNNNYKDYRLNVGIILMNEHNQVFWGRRADLTEAWQFPQGGILPDESPKEAMYRELLEELNLASHAVEYVCETSEWLCYSFPQRIQREGQWYKGQCQKWFLLRLLAQQGDIQLDRSAHPEFDQWRWVEYGYAIEHVVAFKKEIYQKVFKIFEKIIKE